MIKRKIYRGSSGRADCRISRNIEQPYAVEATWRTKHAIFAPEIVFIGSTYETAKAFAKGYRSSYKRTTTRLRPVEWRVQFETA